LSPKPGRRFRILYLITDLDPGGAEKSLLQLCRHLDKDRFSVRVLALTGGSLLRPFHREGIEARILMGRRSVREGICAVSRLAFHLLRFRPHVLHTFLFHAGLLGRVAAFLCRIPRVVSSVRVMEPRCSHLWLDRLTHFLVDLEVCNSEAVRDYRRKVCGIPGRKLRVAYNGVEGERKEDSVSACEGEGRSAPMVLTLARLERQKGIADLLGAFREVRKEFPSAILVIAGRGGSEKSLRARARALFPAEGDEGAVRFVGFREDAGEWISRCDCYVQASHWEGLPNAVLEAMASARPVVVTAAGGSPEVIRHGENGLLVPPGDTAALAGAIRGVLRDRASAGRLGRNARRYVSSMRWDEMARSYERLYEELSA
jgi:starch synthase (maltosyl-transferring)